MFKNDKELLRKAAFCISLARSIESDCRDFCEESGYPFTDERKKRVANNKGKLMKEARSYLAKAQEKVNEEIICYNTQTYRDNPDSYLTREWVCGDFDNMSKSERREWAESRRDMGESLGWHSYSPTGKLYCSYTYLVKYGSRGWAQISEMQYDV